LPKAEFQAHPHDSKPSKPNHKSLKTNQEKSNDKRKKDRRKIERRKAKAGVTVRHDNGELGEKLPPKRIRWAKFKAAELEADEPRSTKRLAHLGHLV
jgi:hypothetical protein